MTVGVVLARCAFLILSRSFSLRVDYSLENSGMSRSSVSSHSSTGWGLEISVQHFFHQLAIVYLLYFFCYWLICSNMKSMVSVSVVTRPSPVHFEECLGRFWTCSRNHAFVSRKQCTIWNNGLKSSLRIFWGIFFWEMEKDPRGATESWCVWEF